jgi:signal transduction histidine kinase
MAMAFGDVNHESQLLRAILDGTRAAMLLVSDTGTIAFTNAPARELFFAGREARGDNLIQILATVSEPLRRPLLSEDDQIFSYEDRQGPETYHLSKSHLLVDGEPHTLISVQHMTAEISRQEVATLKNTLRIIGHELGNSMTPVASLLQSARQMVTGSESEVRLVTALQIVEERLQHLHGFLAGLAQLGQLPKPQKREVALPAFLNGLRALWPDLAMPAAPPAPAWFDPIQIQQVLINLVKNAHEAGGPREAVALELESTPDAGARFTVVDRGPGMTDEVMKKALLPSFTTKSRGSGMGLWLCREIIDAHDGRLKLTRRDGGGMAVSCWLPPRIPDPALTRGRLTLTGIH